MIIPGNQIQFLKITFFYVEYTWTQFKLNVVMVNPIVDPEGTSLQ
jgi:hypothetical protein